MQLKASLVPPMGPLVSPEDAQGGMMLQPGCILRELQAVNKLLWKGTYRIVPLQGLDLLSALYVCPGVNYFGEELHMKLVKPQGCRNSQATSCWVKKE